MTHALILNAAVCLLTALALLALWRQDRHQGFALFLGLANGVQALVPLAYWLTQTLPTPWQSAPAMGLAAIAATNTVLLLGGAAQLCAHALTAHGLVVVGASVLATNLLAQVMGGLALMQTSVAGLNTAIAVLCAYWLRRLGLHWGSPQRWIGPLLVLLGLVQFIYPVWGDAGAATMASLGAVLRLALGLVLMHAALERMRARIVSEEKNAVQLQLAHQAQQHQAASALAEQALRDELTQLPNRAALLELLQQRCAPSAENLPFVLTVLDLDRFKLFNEAHGHSVADQVLQSFAQQLRSSLDSGYQLMRLGEDEFAIVSPKGCAGETAVHIATLVRRMLATPLHTRAGDYFIDVSMGIALYPHSARDVESLLRGAVAALHAAQRTPGTSHELAKKEFERDSSNQLDNEQALRGGIQENEFELVFQPKVDAHNRVLVGFEALARWNRTGGTPVGPQEFVAAAERTGVMPQLGAMLLRQACEKIAVWQAHYGRSVPVAVNVSPVQLLDPAFPALVARVLKETGAKPRSLSLEITESTAVQHLEQATAQVAELRAMGVEVALDDFGAGYSSLNVLRQLRTHSVKIDRALITPLPEPESVAVVHAICELARALDMRVVAEGIETQEHAQAAADAGCHELQGYFFAKALTALEAAQWVALAASNKRPLALELA